MGYGERLEKVAVDGRIFYHFPAFKGTFLPTTSMMKRYSIYGISLHVFHISEYFFDKSYMQNIEIFKTKPSLTQYPVLR
jgi:hypothetical protein